MVTLTVRACPACRGQPFNDMYCAAKFAVEGMSESMAVTLAEFGVHVSVVNPGAIRSNFATRVFIQ